MKQKTIRMRIGDRFSDIHPDEVEHMKKVGWVLAKPVRKVTAKKVAVKNGANS